jgi:hypothetical protein
VVVAAADQCPRSGQHGQRVVQGRSGAQGGLLRRLRGPVRSGAITGGNRHLGEIGQREPPQRPRVHCGVAVDGLLQSGRRGG